mgnify:CR=1 FL=1
MKHEGAIGPNSPLYLQLRELIRGKIENGEYLPGTAITPVGVLAETYGIHRLSVRSAVSAGADLVMVETMTDLQDC